MLLNLRKLVKESQTLHMSVNWIIIPMIWGVTPITTGARAFKVEKES